MTRPLFLLSGLPYALALAAQPGFPPPLPPLQHTQEVSELRVWPAHPTDRDTLTITFTAFVVSSCSYDQDLQATFLPDRRLDIRPPDQARREDLTLLDLRFALSDSAVCTCDLPAYRTLTVRIPPRPAGDHALVMRGFGMPSRTDFIHTGPWVRFQVAPAGPTHALPEDRPRRPGPSGPCGLQPAADRT